MKTLLATTSDLLTSPYTCRTQTTSQKKIKLRKLKQRTRKLSWKTRIPANGRSGIRATRLKIRSPLESS